MLTFIDFFAGCGGFRRGMELAGNKCVGFCEIDKFSVASYTAMHLITQSQYDYIQSLPFHKRRNEILKEEYRNGEFYSNDICRLDAGSLPYSDVWCAGFPCQDLSIAGKKQGLGGSRSGLYYTLIDLLKKTKNKPTYVFLENVKGLLSSKDGWDFANVLIKLDEAGYDTEWCMLNSKDFGVSQNRERIYLVGHLRGRCSRKIFPVKFDSETLTNRTKFQNQLIYPISAPNRINKRQNGRRVKKVNENMFTLTVQDRHGVILRQVRTEYGKKIRKEYESGKLKISRHKFIKYETRKDNLCNTITTVSKDNLLYTNSRIRYLTPKECFRLQGWTDNYFNLAAMVNSDTQLYKQAGNGVTVTVIQSIAEKMNTNDMHCTDCFFWSSRMNLPEKERSNSLLDSQGIVRYE